MARLPDDGRARRRERAALEELHDDTGHAARIVHRDVKPANLLLVERLCCLREQ